MEDDLELAWKAAGVTEAEKDRRRVREYLRIAELGGRTSLCPPHVPIELWEATLGEPIAPGILAKARELWEGECGECGSLKELYNPENGHGFCSACAVLG